MAVSLNCGVLVVGVRTGLHVRASYFSKLPYRTCTERLQFFEGSQQCVEIADGSPRIQVHHRWGTTLLV